MVMYVFYPSLWFKPRSVNFSTPLMVAQSSGTSQHSFTFVISYKDCQNQTYVLFIWCSWKFSWKRLLCENENKGGESNN